MSALSPDVIQGIAGAVDRHFEAEIDLLQRLVRSPSLRGQEAPVQEIVAGELERRGFDIDRFPVDHKHIREGHPAFSPATIDYSGTFNVVGVRGPTKRLGRSLALNAHVDVVPTADPARWSHPPFAAVRKGDWLYGRGAGDMKAGLVANLSR